MRSWPIPWRLFYCHPADPADLPDLLAHGPVDEVLAPAPEDRSPRGDDRCLQFLRAGGCRGHQFIWAQLRCRPGNRGGGTGGGASDAFAGGDRSEK